MEGRDWSTGDEAKRHGRGGGGKSARDGRVKGGRLREEGKAVWALCYFHRRVTAGPDSMRPSRRERDIRLVREFAGPPGFYILAYDRP